MIERLESAGLGFYVKATETQQKLGWESVLYLSLFNIVGKIPLRQLVYRVLDLPPSMRPLVYDFGQLSAEIEREYITQIVDEKCSFIADIDETDMVASVITVLTWSQNYMRQRKV